MKKTFSSILVAALTVFTFLTISCDVGMGEAVDLEAPEITVSRMVAYEGETATEPKTSFATTLFTKSHVKFYGTAFDNTGVKNVYAEIKWLGEEDFTYFKRADLSGENWVLDINFEKEGACWLKIVSEDNKKNYGTKSAKVVTLFVDNNAPAGDAWYIDRLVNGIQYNLQTKEALKKILEEDPKLLQPSNIDVAQNVKFNICSSFSDASGIQTVSISLFKENGEKICELTKTSDSSNYAPRFVVDASQIPNLPASGDHLIQVKYSATDIVSPNSNSVTEKDIDMGWFLWWPESDNPRCYIPQEGESGNINLHINDALNVTVFDDDGFKSGEKIECILKDASGTRLTNSNGQYPSYTPKAGERQCNIKVDAPGEAQTLSLRTTASDASGKSLVKDNTVLVTDDNHPTLIIEAPENNQIPTVDSASLITFKGIALDSSGCTNLKFVWIPESANVVDKKNAALEVLNADNSTAPSGAVSVTTLSSGLKLYNVKLSAEELDNGLKKQTFNFTQSLLNDFLDSNGKIDNNEKYFYIRLIRKDGNYTDSELKLSSDTIKPEIKLIGRGNMSLVDKDTPLVLKFMAKKSNGVKIDSSSYKVTDGEGNTISGTYNANEVAYTESNGTEVKGVYTCDAISTDELTAFFNNNKNPKYTLYAKDILGNSISEDFQFIISALPQISSISSSAPELCKIEPIMINVSFTKPVSVSDSSGIKLKLKNIKRNGSGENTVRYASLVGGQGSTTLIFQYDVQPGDESTGLQVYNEPNAGPIVGIPETTAHLKVLGEGQNLQDKKTIKIDGIAPKVTNVVITTDSVSENVFDGTDYLKEGRTVTATVTVNKKVTVQGTPKFNIGTFVLDWQGISSDGKVLTFRKKIKKGEFTDGLYTYSKDNCIDGLDIIKDAAGNELENALTGNYTKKIYIDTSSSDAPVIKNSAGNALESGKFMSEVIFKIYTDAEVKTEYSVDGGSNWLVYSDFGSSASSEKTITATSSVVSVTLVARITDRAGNVSKYSEPLSLEINNAFPKYTVECTNADKNYKEGKLTFKVYFESPVKIAADATAEIILSANDSDTEKFGSATHKAVLKTKGVETSEATFEYTIQSGDSFTLKINKDDVKLYGISDLYGFTQSGLELEEDYSRPKIRCDNVPPTVKKMTPGGTKTSFNGTNIYSNGKVIELEFSEPVKVNTGKIYLRQTAGWAIPPMFNITEFNKVTSAVKSNGNKKIGSLTGTEILYMDGLEDVEGPLSDKVGPANYIYHGTGQFVGPYKKSSQGLKDDGKSPNYKDTKYVLDFDMDIWGDEGKKFGTTFNTGNASRQDTVSQSGQVVVKEGSTTITTKNIRDVLESIHFHERTLSVNSASVSIDSDNKKKVTLTIPNGFLGDSALQPGLEWELVIEKGAFMDETGNFFGYEADGTKTNSDSRQATNLSSDVSAEWGRKRNTVSSTDNVKPLVLIQDGANPSFLSGGVAKPVVRVDRYSYGLGIYQPKIENGEIVRDFVQTVTSGENFYGSKKIIPTKPTAQVRVRIDCQTKDASIRHVKSTAVSKAIGNVTNTDNGGDRGVTSYASDSFTGLTVPSAPASATEGSGDVLFLSGSGDHKKSYVQLIYARAFLNGQKSEVEKEGIFQTVLCMVNPTFSNGRSIFEDYAGYNDVSVRGTTGWAGEPSISPFPLRDSAVSSPYLRRAYPDYYDGDNKNYYWISYEILIDSSMSIYSWGPNKNYCDWGQNWGLMKPGEFNKISNLKNWQ